MNTTSGSIKIIHSNTCADLNRTGISWTQGPVITRISLKFVYSWYMWYSTFCSQMPLRIFFPSKINIEQSLLKECIDHSRTHAVWHIRPGSMQRYPFKFEIGLFCPTTRLCAKRFYYVFIGFVFCYFSFSSKFINKISLLISSSEYWISLHEINHILWFINMRHLKDLFLIFMYFSLISLLMVLPLIDLLSSTFFFIILPCF